MTISDMHYRELPDSYETLLRKQLATDFNDQNSLFCHLRRCTGVDQLQRPACPRAATSGAERTSEIHIDETEWTMSRLLIASPSPLFPLTLVGMINWMISGILLKHVRE
jgi:hypothetical protein